MIPPQEFTLAALAQFLAHVPKLSERADTFFSIGGRGYYENPTSDVLAYFLQPGNQHPFGLHFLHAMLRCVGLDPTAFPCGKISVSREVRTDHGRLDLVIVSEKWVLVIENKIRHWDANDFEEYKTFVNNCYPHKERVYVLLSPKPTKQGDWHPVTYKAYLEELRRDLPSAASTVTQNKWLIFANDFITHLENEIYPIMSPLTTEEIAFVEKHMPEINKVKVLMDAYLADLLNKLKTSLADLFEHEITGWPEWWGFKFQELGTQFYFRSRLHPNTKHFHTGIWVSSLSDAEKQSLVAPFQTMHLQYSRGEGGAWDGAFDTMAEATEALTSIATQLAKIHRKRLSE